MTRPVTQIVLVVSLLGDLLITAILLLSGWAGGNPALLAVALFIMGGFQEKQWLLTGYRIRNYPAVHGLERKHAVILRFFSGLFLLVSGFLLIMAILRLLANGYMITVGALTLLATFAAIILKIILYCNTMFAAHRIKSRLLYTEICSQRNGLLILAVACVALTVGRLGYPTVHGLAALSISVLVIRLGTILMH